MPLIAPGCMRFTVSGTIDGGGSWANIWDVRVLADVANDRGVVARDYASVLINQWVAQLAPIVTSNVGLTSVSWVDLDSADGSVGTVAGTASPGLRNAAPTPNNVAILVTKAGTGTRGQRTGRWYQVGIPEGEADWQSLTGNYRSEAQDAFTGWLEETTDPEGVDASVLPTVIHTRRSDPDDPTSELVYTGNSLITGMIVQTRMATQRRRLRR